MFEIIFRNIRTYVEEYTYIKKENDRGKRNGFIFYVSFVKSLKKVVEEPLDGRETRVTSSRNST